jgi:hypothetical protein
LGSTADDHTTRKPKGHGNFGLTGVRPGKSPFAGDRPLARRIGREPTFRTQVRFGGFKNQKAAQTAFWF